MFASKHVIFPCICWHIATFLGKNQSTIWRFLCIDSMGNPHPLSRSTTSTHLTLCLHNVHVLLTWNLIFQRILRLGCKHIWRLSWSWLTGVSAYHSPLSWLPLVCLTSGTCRLQPFSSALDRLVPAPAQMETNVNPNPQALNSPLWSLLVMPQTLCLCLSTVCVRNILIASAVWYCTELEPPV